MASLFFLNVIMVTRLGYLMRETSAGVRFTLLTAAIQILSLGVFVPDWPLLALAAVIAVVAALTRYAETRGAHLAGCRSLALLALIAASTTLAGSAEFAPWCRALLSSLGSATVWSSALDAADWRRCNVVAFGLLILTNEVNLVIRYGFYRLKLEPKLEAPQSLEGSAQPETDQQQYNAGRVIGILERYFILVVLLAGGDFAAIAAILAAKGFARFKQLDRREFAEYILIGTLASTLSAVVVALLVIALLPPGPVPGG